MTRTHEQKRGWVSEHSPVATYGLTLVAVALAGLGRWVLDPVLANNLPLYTFYFATIFAAWYGGLGPGLLSLLLGGLCGVYFFVEPRYALTLETAVQKLDILRYIGIAVAVSFICELLHRTQKRWEMRGEYLHTTLTSVGDAVITTDSECRITLLNEVAENLTGWKNEEAVGQPLDLIFNIINEESRQRVQNPAEKALREGIIVGLANHTLLIAKDGSERPIDDSAAPIRDKEGVMHGCVLVFRDVTERRREEHERIEIGKRLAVEVAAMNRLHELVSRLLKCPDTSTALSEVLDAAIILAGADMGNIQLLNPHSGVLELVAHRGFKPESLERFHSVSIDAGTSCARAMKSRERVIIQDIQEDSHYAAHRDIARLEEWHGAQSTPLIARSGELLGMLSTHYRRPHRPAERDLQILDLYARQAADFIERIRADQALREADSRKDEFLAMLAHELRGPLAPIRNMLEIMKRSENGDPMIHQAHRTMDRQLFQMTRLIDDLLDVSRVSRGKIELKRERVELASVIHQAVEASRPLAEHARHELDIALPSDPIYVQADPVRLAQIFGNLLNNACKYTEPGGKIRLAADRIGREVLITITDNGAGIAADKLESIFDLFTQVDRSLERSQGGLGIGLTLVKRLVEMHDGTVDAKSDGEGKGSTFSVRLPVLDDLPKPLMPDPAAEPMNLARRILVVDDNRDSATSLAILLKITGNETRTAHDGLDALKEAEDFLPEIVLLDIGLPKLNGYEVCRRIREQAWGKEMTLIALTGWGQDEDRRKSQEAGFNHHLVKPVDHTVLMKLLADLSAKADV